jgi:hypothetical protein
VALRVNEGASQAPYGFVFQLIQKPDDSLAWNLIAVGESHLANERTRNVYERARSVGGATRVDRPDSRGEGERARIWLSRLAG